MKHGADRTPHTLTKLSTEFSTPVYNVPHLGDKRCPPDGGWSRNCRVLGASDDVNSGVWEREIYLSRMISTRRLAERPLLVELLARG